MMYRIHKRFICAIILACLMLSMLASAHAEVYVNDSSGVVGSLDGAYAVGGAGEAEAIGGSTIYAITGNGVEAIGGAEVSPPPTVEVPSAVMYIGLSFGSTEVSAITLRNSVGSGYKFGFYDANRTFFEIGATTETQITALKDKNVTLTAGVIGCYHIKLPAVYNSFSAAQDAASAYGDGFPAYYNGSWNVLVGHYEKYDDAASAAVSRGIQGTAFSASSKCVVVTKAGTSKILFEFDYGDTFSLAIRPVSTGAKAVTSYNGHTYYGDFIFRRITGDNLTVSNAISMEDYVKGVVPYEMSPSWPIEALKAQAVCARTYAASNMNKHRSYGFDTCNSTDCQAYLGTERANATTDQAVDATAGQFVTYEGKLCSTLYFSSDGGATEDNENINVQPYPYLKGVVDPYEQDIVEDYYGKSWSHEFSAAQLRTKLINRGYSIGDIVAVEPTYTRMGNMYSIKFTDSTGKSVTITRYQCVTVMGVQSVRYTIERSEQTGLYVIKGAGWGHNVGMSQWGAYSMAKYHNKGYVEIIKFYYTGVSVG